MFNRLIREELQWRVVLSGLWILFLLNILFRVTHEFFRIGYIGQILSGVVNSKKLSEETLFFASLILQLPLLMTVMSLLLRVSTNRLSNLIASPLLFIGVVASSTHPDMDDMLFTLMELLFLVAILWFAWSGPATRTHLR